MVKEIVDVLRRGRLSIHFNRSVNLLADKDSSRLDQVARYLDRIINKNTYYELLDQNRYFWK